MLRVLSVFMAAGTMLAGVQAASAQYHGPVAYRDAAPRYYGEHYERYDAPRYYEDRRPYLSGHRYHRPLYYEQYPEDDLFIRPRYPDHYGDDRVVREEEPGTFRESEQGFDPRRPHLGDGTDAPDEQYYARRPRSCGEYYYWDGRACVDARKYPPYVGPKP